MGMGSQDVVAIAGAATPSPPEQLLKGAGRREAGVYGCHSLLELGLEGLALRCPAAFIPRLQLHHQAPPTGRSARHGSLIAALACSECLALQPFGCGRAAPAEQWRPVRLERQGLPERAMHHSRFRDTSSTDGRHAARSRGQCGTDVPECIDMHSAAAACSLCCRRCHRPVAGAARLVPQPWSPSHGAPSSRPTSLGGEPRRLCTQALLPALHRAPCSVVAARDAGSPDQCTGEAD